MRYLHSECSALLVLCLVGGCGTRGQSQKAGPEVCSGSPSQLCGRVVVTGSEPLSAVTLMGDKGESTTIVGGLAPELRRLSGATVLVSGTEADRGPGKSLDVQKYEVLSIDGQRPAVGILAYTHGTMSLAGRDTVQLTSVPEGLRGKAGAKVWIVGRRAGATLQVQSFGILRDPGG